MKTKKELKAEYKQKKPVRGVFQIKNKTNDMVLIEGSTNIASKWNRHKTELKFGSHRNIKLQKDWNDLGEDNFVFSVVSELITKDDENIDFNKEVKILLELVGEEMNIEDCMKY